MEYFIMIDGETLGEAVKLHEKGFESVTEAKVDAFIYGDVDEEFSIVDAVGNSYGKFINKLHGVEALSEGDL